MEPVYVTLGFNVARIDVAAKDNVTLTLFSAEHIGCNGERVPATSFCVSGVKGFTDLNRAISDALGVASEMSETETPF